MGDSLSGNSSVSFTMTNNRVLQAVFGTTLSTLVTGNGAVAGPGSVAQFAINANGSISPLSPATVPAGNTSTSATVSVDGKFLYVTNATDSPEDVESPQSMAVDGVNAANRSHMTTGSPK